VLIAVCIPISLHSHASSVPVLNDLNFFNWSEQVHFHLGVLDLDLTFQIEKHVVVIDASSNEKKAHHRA